MPYPGRLVTVTVGLGPGSLRTAVVRTVTVVRVGGVTTGGDGTTPVSVSVGVSGGDGSLLMMMVVATGGGGGGGSWVVSPGVSVTVSMMVSVTMPQTVGNTGVLGVPGMPVVPGALGVPGVSVVPGVPGVPGTLG